MNGGVIFYDTNEIKLQSTREIMFIHTSSKLDVAFVKTKQNVNVYAVYLIKLSIFQSPELSWISLDPKYIPFLQPVRA